jgi:3-deoxy-manno-octulosonate cytidylyltransferase (CMP-KDO synthetase)
MEAVIIIPSRLGSSRFPNKPMAKINGKEMILHVCERASKAFTTIVATPDIELRDFVITNGYPSILTGKHMTGTDRVAEVANKIDADIYINVQGDEPLIDVHDIDIIYNCKKKAYNSVIGSMQYMRHNAESVVKVLENAGQLINLTRTGTARYIQCGLYAFNRDELKAFAEYEDKEQSLEKHENIELMRFVDMGYAVKMAVVNGGIAVDMPEDIYRVEEEIEHERK